MMTWTFLARRLRKKRRQQQNERHLKKHQAKRKKVSIYLSTWTLFLEPYLQFQDAFCLYDRKLCAFGSHLLTWLYLCTTLTGGKSSVLLDVKPWDDETDMKKLEEVVRSVQMPGLFWGACMCFCFTTRDLF
jgi:hypothetical protein